MIRVVVAEDSSTARALIVEVLANDPEIEVVAEARTGVEAVEIAARLRPDLITMDIEMPVMDGLEAARAIMAQTPTPIVVVSSSTNRAEADRSLTAIAAGALAVIDKPASPFAPRFEEWREQLLAAVKAMAHVKVVRRVRRRDGATPTSIPLVTDRAATRVRIVAVAASTGGPAVLLQILRQLPRDFPAPVVVVQHIARGFCEALAVWLRASGSLQVKVAVNEERLQPGVVYLAPDDRQLGVADGRVVLEDSPRVGGFRPSATHLFESVARSYGRGTVALILTGMGTDGVAGLRSVRDVGGRVIAQDEESCVVFGMPREAVRAGVVDHVLNPSAIADELAVLARRKDGAN